MEAAGTGRFAPSPTGDLHSGSLIAALASACDARQCGCHWRLRIDDIDPPRACEGAAGRIPASLRRFGFRWDGEIIWQSLHSRRYRQALHRLNAAGMLYPCRCSRRSLRDAPVYPGFCRPRQPVPNDPHVTRLIDADGMADAALRVRLDGSVQFDDGVFGRQTVNMPQHSGDVIVKRRDGLFAYHLACAVDDSFPVSRVVRGADLLDSTAAQIAIMHCLGTQVPCYAHVPVATDSAGDKLSKHSLATAIDTLEPLPALLQAWEFLGQTRLPADSLDTFWSLAPAAFRLDAIPAVATRRLTAASGQPDSG